MPKCAKLSTEYGSWNSAVCTNISGVLMHTVCTLTCHAGYHLLGEPIVKCMGDHWNATEPSCELILCGMPNADVTTEISTTAPGPFPYATVLEFTCRYGYEIESGHTQRQCLSNDFWSGEMLVCQEILCEEPDASNNTVITSSGPYCVDDPLIYTCIEGTELVDGSLERLCQTNGTFSSKSPQCHSVVCPTPPYANGASCNVSLSGQFTYLDAIQYTCDPGFRHQSGDSVRVCSDEKSWSGVAIGCELINCNQPSNIANAQVDYNGTTVWSVATYSCVNGYRASTMNTMSACSLDGNWEPTVNLECAEIVCPTITNSNPNSSVVWSSLSIESTAQYVCDEGYEPTPGSVMVSTCQPDGMWSDAVFCCQLIDYGPPDEVASAEVTWTGTTLGSRATYRCLPGMLDQHDHTVSCGIQGWQTVNITCVAVTCQEPFPIHNASVSVDALTFDTKATYSCDAGFEEGNDDWIITCQGNGQWSNTTFFCAQSPVKLDIQEIASLSGLNAKWEGNLTMGSVINFSCQKQYSLVGNSTLEINHIGMFDEELPICEEILCPTLTFLDVDGLSVTQNAWAVNSTISFACDSEFMLVDGDDQLTCTTNGTWAGKIPSCKKIECLQPPKVGNATQTKLFNETSFPIGFQVTYVCMKGFRFTGGNEKHAICMDNGKWSHDIQCERVTCESPPAVGMFMTLAMEDNVYGSVAIFYCFDGYIMSNESGTAVSCQQNGQWSKSVVQPQCVVLTCGRLPVITNTTGYAETFDLNSEATYTCLPDTKFVGGEKKKYCDRNGTWTGEDLQCEYSPGGEAVVIFVPPEKNLTEAEQYDKAIGFKPSDRKPTNMALGSLVGSIFVSAFIVLIIILDLATIDMPRSKDNNK